MGGRSLANRLLYTIGNDKSGKGGVRKRYPSLEAQVQPHLIINNGHQMDGGGSRGLNNYRCVWVCHS